MAPLFYLGAMSPYAWLAAERIGELIADARWRPVFLGAIFKASGRSSWALGEKRAEGMADCEARARARGLGELHWPERWPTSDLVVARAMLVAERMRRLERFALEAMRMAFREGADLGELEHVLEAGRRSGIGGGELEAAIAAQEINDALREANDEALARGVFGVPTVIVGEQLFWGDDRLEQAATVAASAAA